MTDGGDTAGGPAARAVREDEAGRNCPYCRFPLKTGAPAAICPACSAAHHAECWTDNRGCAVIACAAAPSRIASAPSTPSQSPTLKHPAAGGTQTPAQSASQLASPPPARPRGSASNRGLALAIAALAVGVIAVAAVLLLNGTRSSPAAGTSSPRSQPDAASASTTSTSATQTTTTSTGSTATPNTPALTTYESQTYAIGYPTGWQTVSQDVSHGAYVESKWSAPGNPAVYLLIDQDTQPFSGTAEDGAVSVHSAVEQTAGYSELAWNPQSFSAGQGWVWQFTTGTGKEEIDTFFTHCDTGYAILGAAPIAQFSQYQRSFEVATASFQPSCGSGE